MFSYEISSSNLISNFCDFLKLSLQTSSSDGNKAILAPDCFHLEKRGHQLLALMLWNTMACLYIFHIHFIAGKQFLCVCVFFLRIKQCCTCFANSTAYTCQSVYQALALKEVAPLYHGTEIQYNNREVKRWLGCVEGVTSTRSLSLYACRIHFLNHNTSI